MEIHNNNYHQSQPKDIKYRKINTSTLLTFENLVKNSSWDNVLSEKDPEKAFSLFYDKIENYTDISFPEVTKKFHFKEKINFPWFSEGLRISNQNKNKLAGLKLRKPTEQNILNYKKYLSVYNKLIRKAKILHYQEIFKESRNNIKKTWDTIFTIIGKKKCKEDIPDYFLKNGQKILGSQNIANEFNNFFSSIGSELASKIGESNKKFYYY